MNIAYGFYTFVKHSKGIAMFRDACKVIDDEQDKQDYSALLRDFDILTGHERGSFSHSLPLSAHQRF